MTFTGRSRAAFSLIELVLAVFVIATLAAVLWPVLAGSLPRMQMDRSVQDLYAVLTRVRQEAILTARTYEVHVEPAEGRYLVYVEEDPLGDPGALHPAGGALRGPFSLADRVGFSGSEATQEVKFKPDGTADAATFTLAHENGATRTLRVDPKTGYVEVQE